VIGLLLDTHALFWFDARDPRIPGATLRRLQESELPLVVSVVSIYEMAVAIAKGRWPEAAVYFPDAAARLEAAGYAVLPITGPHVEVAARLPRHHNDPWDRLLVATALSENLTLVTADLAVQAYDADWLWA
jgi:PIN domain nuclease of toxin-antitoxin system